ncbi:MAG: RNA methyltransferase [Chloroflexi bacterium HGW-Chloroflexi-3]|nr:MAG: RNA methyltransferase [Chloroflexi bacterium HGW-Chloroflexi-3]
MITSPSNPKIKFIRKLRTKKFRDENQLFYIEGPRIISEAIDAKWNFAQVFYSQELITDPYSKKLLGKLLSLNTECFEVDKQVFESFSIKDGPKGLAAVLFQKTFELNYFAESKGLWVGLDRIQDPGNLGSILRTLDAVGGSGIILIDQCTDPFDIAAVRGSMGALFSLKIIKTTRNNFLQFLDKKNITIIGTSDKSDKDYQAIQYKNDMILMMGSEREGLSVSLIEGCDKLVRIPMVGKSDSLNLAVATSICLYEIFNQNRKK